MTRRRDSEHPLPVPGSIPPADPAGVVEASGDEPGAEHPLHGLPDLTGDRELAAVIQNDTELYNSEPVPGGTRVDRAGAPRELTARQQNAIELLVTGHSDAAVAERVKVTRVTVTRWRLYHLTFQAELNRRRQEVWGGQADRVRSLLRRAVRVFRRQVDSDDPDLSFRAAKALLDYAAGGKFAPPTDPTDPLAVLDAHARRKRRERCAPDPCDAPIEDQDRLLAMEDLARRQRMHGEGEDEGVKG